MNIHIENIIADIKRGNKQAFKKLFDDYHPILCVFSNHYIEDKEVYFQPFDLAPIPENESKVIEIKVEDGKLTPITRQFFIDHIFDFRKWKKWRSNTKGKGCSTK